MSQSFFIVVKVLTTKRCKREKGFFVLLPPARKLEPCRSAIYVVPGSHLDLGFGLNVRPKKGTILPSLLILSCMPISCPCWLPLGRIVNPGFRQRPLALSGNKPQPEESVSASLPHYFIRDGRVFLRSLDLDKLCLLRALPALVGNN